MEIATESVVFPTPPGPITRTRRIVGVRVFGGGYLELRADYNILFSNKARGYPHLLDLYRPHGRDSMARPGFPPISRDGRGQLVHGPVRIKNKETDRLDELLNPFRPLEVVVETSPAWPWLFDRLQERGIHFVLAHAKRLRAIAESPRTHHRQGHDEGRKRDSPSKAAQPQGRKREAYVHEMGLQKGTHISAGWAGPDPVTSLAEPLPLWDRRSYAK